VLPLIYCPIRILFPLDEPSKLVESLVLSCLSDAPICRIFYRSFGLLSSMKKIDKGERGEAN
jgi:hypothetical protein